MTPELLCNRPDAQVWHARWQDLVTKVERVDCLIVDAPYSERTHAGHDESAGGHAGYHPKKSSANKRALNYEMWKPTDVEEFVAAWSGATAGWLVSITDHVLAHVWQAALEAAGRYVFAPLAFVAPGSRVRLGGDGPAQWACWIVASRPATRAFSRWGSLPGGYVLPPGHAERMAVVGGKPSWLMERLVEDYSRPGDLVCDPCCGAGTTLTAALRTGRRAIGGDMKREHAEMAARACDGMVQAPLFAGGAR